MGWSERWKNRVINETEQAMDGMKQVMDWMDGANIGMKRAMV